MGEFGAVTRPSVTRDDLIRRTEEFARATERMRRDGTLEPWRRNLVARRAQRSRRLTDEHRLFIREMTLRSEKLGRELIREIRESRERWSEELRIEMELQRDVMLRILDRLPEPDGTN